MFRRVVAAAVLAAAAAGCSSSSGPESVSPPGSLPGSPSSGVPLTVVAGPYRQVTTDDVSARCASAAEPLWRFVQAHRAGEVAASEELQAEFERVNVEPKRACSPEEFAVVGEVQVLGWLGEAERG